MDAHSFPYCVHRRIPVHEPVAVNSFNEGLNSAASTLASIISRQAFDIPRDARGDDGRVDNSSDSKDEDEDEDCGYVHRAADGRRSGVGGRFSLPNISGTGGDGDDDTSSSVGSEARARRDSFGSGLRMRLDSFGSGPPARPDTPIVSGVSARRDARTGVRDPFGSPVTPQMYNGFRRHTVNNRAAAAGKTAAASSWLSAGRWSLTRRKLLQKPSSVVDRGRWWIM